MRVKLNRARDPLRDRHNHTLKKDNVSAKVPKTAARLVGPCCCPGPLRRVESVRWPAGLPALEAPVFLPDSDDWQARRLT